MTQNQQPTIRAANGRRFPTVPIAVQAILINPAEELLLLSSPTRNGGQWGVIAGGLEAGETVLDGAARELREEAGPVRARPLGVVHCRSFHYDAQVQYMIGVHYLFAYEGGQVIPGDDMADAQYRWWSLDEVETAVAAGELHFHPSTDLWLLYRAVGCYRQWIDHPPALVDLQNPTLK